MGGDGTALNDLDLNRAPAAYDDVNMYQWGNNNDNSSIDDYDFVGNGTNNTVVIHALGYSTLHIVISSIVLTFMMIVVVIGNMLVIIAIATEKSLKNLQNWFIASLAVADFFVGLLIMPFSLANELMGYWIFGTVWCSIHSAMDVLLCTSSIMNICLISLDRYWSITQAVDYLKKRTPMRAAIMIAMVWILSALISIPPLLGWRDPKANNSPVPTCQLSREIGYVLYSALGSFYIPSCIMVFVYIRIYFAARARARRCVRKPPKPKPPSSAAIEIEERSRGGGSVTEGSTTKATTSTGAATAACLLPQTNASRDGGSGGGGSGGTNTCISRDSPSLPPTPDGRTSKQVGFQEPLTGKKEVIVNPEITVESCSPELTAAAAAAAAAASSGDKDQKLHEQLHKRHSTNSGAGSNNNCTTSSNNNGNGENLNNNAQERQTTVEVVSERTNSSVDSKSETHNNNNNNNNTNNNMDVMMTSDPLAIDTTAMSAVDSQNKSSQDNVESKGSDQGGGGGVGSGSGDGSQGSSPKHTSPSENSVVVVGTNRDQETQDSPKVGCSKDSSPTDPLLTTRVAGGETLIKRDSDSVDKPNNQQPLVPTVHLKQSTSTMEDECSSASNRLPHQQSTLAVSDLESKMSELQSNGSSGRPDEGSASHSSTKKSKGSKLHFLRVETPTIWRTSSSLSLNGDVHILGTLSRSCSRLQLDMDPVSDVEPSSSDSGAVSRCAVVKPLKLRLCQPFFGKKSASNKARRDVLDMGKLPSPKEVRDPEREKRRIARKKEKRATLILGLIMGSFILCWLPFFFLYILEPLCPSCHVAPWGFAIAFWLGYMNSALNPVIYTIFNKDFRRAFRRILFK